MTIILKVSNMRWKLAMIYKVRMAACAISAAAMVDGLVWCANGWDASLGLDSTVVHFKCTAAPKIVWNARLDHFSPLNSQSFWRLVHSNNWCRFSAASETTTALLQTMLNHIYNENQRQYSTLLSPDLQLTCQPLSAMIINVFLFISLSTNGEKLRALEALPITASVTISYFST